MNDLAVVALCGMVAGGAAFLLGIAQLTCEHARSPMPQRLTTGVLAGVAAWTGLDCWDVLSGLDATVDAKAVVFSLALALSWGYRRARGLVTERPGPNAVRPGPCARKKTP
jgi:hypothetical protein